MPRRFLAHPFVAWLGMISYGIYLWHLPLVAEIGRAGSSLTGHQMKGHAATAAIAVCTALAAVLCAAASYYVVERPLLRYKNGFVRRPRGDVQAAEAAVAAPAQL
jgi:peptidoglycan/LPS O-acetylase OafA/YrhL